MTKTYQLMDQFYKENNSKIKILIKEIIDAEPTLTEEYLYESIRIALKGNFTSSHPENFFSVGCKKNINIQVQTTDKTIINVMKNIATITTEDVGVGKTTMEQYCRNIISEFSEDFRLKQLDEVIEKLDKVIKLKGE